MERRRHTFRGLGIAARQGPACADKFATSCSCLQPQYEASTPVLWSQLNLLLRGLGENDAKRSPQLHGPGRLTSTRTALRHQPP